MGNPHAAFADRTRATAPADGADTADDSQVARNAQDDLRLVKLPRVNVLLTGQEHFVRRILDQLRPDLASPVVSWVSGNDLTLPAAGQIGTVILHEVGALRLDEQIQLLEWLGRAVGRTQVVSTSREPLLPRVRAGAFIDTLYYRLNTVYVEAES